APLLVPFFFSSRRRHTRSLRDWSSDVCSSDLPLADVLKPLPVKGPFASAALHAVLHCLPGPMERKAKAVSNVAAVLQPDGVLFRSEERRVGKERRARWTRYR